MLMLASASVAHLEAQQLYIPLPKGACRILDTRIAPAEALKAGERREIPSIGVCGIPPEAKGVWANITILPLSKSFGFITVYPSETEQPTVSLMNSLDGSLRSNAAIVGLSSFTPPAPENGSDSRRGGAFTAYVTDETHLIVDVSGYFIKADSFTPAVSIPSSFINRIETRMDKLETRIEKLELEKLEREKPKQ